MAKRRGNNEGTIYQKADGKWRAQVTCKGERRSHTGTTRKECQEWIKTTIRKFDDGLTPKGAKITVEEHCQSWLTMKSTILRPYTYKQYRQIMRDYIIPELGKTLLVDLESQQIQNLYNAKVEEGVGLRTIEYVHAIFRGCLNHAVRLNILSKNPALATNPPKPDPEEIIVLDEDQIQNFILAAQALQPGNYPFYQLALTTGMRKGEILGLKWEDLDWIRRTIVVKRQLKRSTETGFFFSPPKTKAGSRTIVLGERTIAIFKEHHQKWLQRRENFDPDWAREDLIFTEEDGSPLRYRRVYSEFKALLESAALPDIRFHDLRHTAASQMLVNGVDILTVTRRLGHAKSSVTLDIYGHLTPGAQEKAASVMDNLTTPVAIFTQKTAPKLHPK